MSDWAPFRYVFRLIDGSVVFASPYEAKRVIDQRNKFEGPQTVWEVKVNGIVRRFWPEEIASWTQEELTPTKELKQDAG